MKFYFSKINTGIALNWLVAVYSLQSTVYSLQFTVYSLQFTVYSLQSTVYCMCVGSSYKRI